MPNWREQLKQQEPSLFWKDAYHCTCYPPNPEQNQTEVLPDRIMSFMESKFAELIGEIKLNGRQHHDFLNEEKWGYIQALDDLTTLKDQLKKEWLSSALGRTETENQ